MDHKTHEIVEFQLHLDSFMFGITSFCKARIFYASYCSCEQVQPFNLNKPESDLIAHAILSMREKFCRFKSIQYGMLWI